MLASGDLGIHLAGELNTVAPSSQEGGIAHTAQAADGWTQSKPADAPQPPRKL